MKTRLLVAGGIALVVASAALYLAWRSAHEAVAFSEDLVRGVLERSLGAELEWKEMEVALDPPAVTLSQVRARWPGAPELIALASRVALQPALHSPGEPLAFAFARFEALRFESSGLPGLSAGPHPVALRWLEVERAAREQNAEGVDSPARWASGTGEFAGGGTLRFEVRRSLVQSAGAVGTLELELHVADVPPAEWGVLVPQLQDASGTISGELIVELAAEAGRANSRGDANGGAGQAQTPREMSGRFDIDATAAELLIAGAYTKPLGDPATLRGRFVRTPEGGFELEEARVSIRKGKASVQQGVEASPGREP